MCLFVCVKNCRQSAAATATTTISELTSVIGLCFVLFRFFFPSPSPSNDRSLRSNCDFWTAPARQQQKAFLVVAVVVVVVLVAYVSVYVNLILVSNVLLFRAFLCAALCLRFYSATAASSVLPSSFPTPSICLFLLLSLSICLICF